MNCEGEKASKRGNISEVIQKQAKKISSPVISDFLIAARRGFTGQVLQGLKEGGSGKASSTDKVASQLVNGALSSEQLATLGWRPISTAVIIVQIATILLCLLLLDPVVVGL